MMLFEEGHLKDIRACLLGSNSADLIHMMHLKGLGQESPGASEKDMAMAIDLGWINPQSGALTDLGVCAADSCREYQFWLDRDRKTPFDGYAPYLSADHFQGRKVLEIGSGMGANLMSISATGAQAAGVEPVEAYIQLGAILNEREGLPPPDVRRGSAEDIPFTDGTADLILCITAHQYFEILPAIQEITRTLRSGGELIVIGATLRSYFWNTLPTVLRTRAGASAFAVTVTNSLSYMAVQRRLIPARTEFTTSRPIYPTRAALTRWFLKAGFEEISAPIRVGPETCIRLRLK